MYCLETLEKLNSPAYTTGVKPKRITQPEDVFKVPSSAGKKLNEYGLELIDTFFCDSSGFGLDNEPALTTSQLLSEVERLLYQHEQLWGVITVVGQFQVYINLYIKKGSAHYA